MAEIEAWSALEEWLAVQPVEVSMAIASRAALRTVPRLRHLSQNFSIITNTYKRNDRLIPILFGSIVPIFLISGIKEQINNTFTPRNKAFNAADQFKDNEAVISLILSANSAAFNDSLSDRSAEAAIETIRASFSSINDARTWISINNDRNFIEDFGPKKLISEPLWKSGAIPAALLVDWPILRDELLADNPDFDVWTKWYEARVKGEPLHIDELRIRAGMETEWLDKGAAAYNAELKRRLREAGKWGDAAAQEDGLLTVDETELEDDLPVVPAPRPAAIEPVVEAGVIKLPKGRATSDLSGAGAAAALAALKTLIVTLAEDAAAESNPDKRAIPFLNRLAEAIPAAEPSQFELFRLAHEEAALSGYSKTVMAEWPDLLAQRYLGLQLAFDRTLRQFPKWRAFVRNAQRRDLKPTDLEQIRNAAQVLAGKLKQDESAQYVDAAVADSLADLADPLPDEGTRSQAESMAAIEVGYERLAEDVLESTNNIVKLISEIAIGMGGTAQEAAGAWAKEAKKSTVKAAATEGKAFGPGLFKWAKRTIKWIVMPSGAVSALIAKFPDLYGWLISLARFVQ